MAVQSVRGLDGQSGGAVGGAAGGGLSGGLRVK